MKPVGKQLQEARLAKNWTPELAARETKIKVDRLRDLEADDYTHFTSPAYARGFVRTYARALGLDEYKILRQLDNKLPDDDTSSIVTESGVAYLPETSMPPRVAHRDYTGLYIVMALGCGVLLIITVVLFEAYRVGELPRYFAAEAPSSEATAKTSDTNGVSSTAEAESPPHALPVDPNDTSHAPKAEPVDLSALATDTNAAPSTNAAPVAAVASTDDPNFKAVRALPVDPSQLAQAPPATTPAATPATAAIPAPATPTAPAATVLASTDTTTPPRALPVDPNDLVAPTAIPAAEPVSTNGVAQASPAPAASETATPPSPSARQSNTGPVILPPAAPIAPPVTTDAAVASDTATNAAPETAADSAKRLVLTASQDSFVRVTSLDASDTEKPLYAAVLRSGQSVGFDGHKFSINVGIPSAVDIKLDGVNYGPHSDQDAPETFTVESHQQ